MPGPLTYWHTIKYLKPIQFYGRIWFRLVRPYIDLRPAPPLRLLSDRDWMAPARRKASLVGPERFFFLNKTYDLADSGWDDPSIEKLLRYNLHYFDDLNAQNAVVRSEWHRELLSHWVRENQPTVGTGWESYPTSLRIVNWIKWALEGNMLPPENVQSLATQVRWLSRRLEIHLLGNHLFANAKALVFAGLFFDGSEASTWLEKGLRIIDREVQEQILADGGHFERSTMYHALALEDMLDLCNVTTAFNDAIPVRWQSTILGWRERVDAMRAWLAAMCHPDGEICYFNDAAMGIAPAPIELEQYAVRLGFPRRSTSIQRITHLMDSGYIRIEQDEVVAVLDVAPIGPDYLPGHAHADTLSFELSLFGKRVFVNSGTSCYGTSVERLRQRGTGAHNTVVIDGQDSSEVWAGFRVARRARPVGLRVICNGEIIVRCAHDGYRRLQGTPQHLRQWLFGKNMLVVEDHILGDFEHAEVRFHLHPSITLSDIFIDSDRGCEILLKLPQGQDIHLSIEGGVLRKQITTWHPEFGCSKKNFCLIGEFNCSVFRTSVKWGSAI